MYVDPPPFKIFQLIFMEIIYFRELINHKIILDLTYVTCLNIFTKKYCETIVMFHISCRFANCTVLY